jgi:hypothetical protein
LKKKHVTPYWKTNYDYNLAERTTVIYYYKQNWRKIVVEIECSKSAKSEAEDEKIDCSSKDATLTSKKLEKDGTSRRHLQNEEEVQNLTNTYIKKIDELLVVKEAEIMKSKRYIVI